MSLLAWPTFLICAVAIALGGPVLVRNADIIGWRANVARSWIGLVLLATATSLSELITGVSAVTIAMAPDIAVGDVLGSCMFNLLMIVLLDALHRGKSLYGSVTRGHILTAGYGVIAIGFSGAAILAARNGGDLAFANVGIATPVIFIIYIAAMRGAYRYEGILGNVNESIVDHSSVSMNQALVRYAAAAILIVVAATLLPVSAVEISKLMGWNQVFVGLLFVAAATSLPELVVSISALRMRAPDLAIANLLGSNLFNILVLGIDDIAYRQGSLLTVASEIHAVTAFLGVVMSGIVVVALTSQTTHRVRGVFSWASICLLFVYLGGGLAMFLMHR